MSMILFFVFLTTFILMMKKSPIVEKPVVRKKNDNKWFLIIMLIPCMFILLPFWIRHEYLVKEKYLMKTYLKEAYGEDFNIIKMKRLVIFFNDIPSTSAVAVLARDKKVKIPISRLDSDILKDGKPHYNTKSYFAALWGNQCKEILENNLNTVKPDLINVDVLGKRYIGSEETSLIKNGEKTIDLISAIKKYPNAIKVQVTLFILNDKEDIESLEKKAYSIIEDLRNKDNLNIYLRIVFVNNSLENRINIFKMRNKLDSGLEMYRREFKSNEITKRYIIESIDEVESIKELEKYVDLNVYFEKID